ncbi:kielin/chordin-like protein [Pleurodeles waltl]|uniref:kielin/chordin-like protein n=1 Tax=Pleurodeles waltl TaxID=8319 RepID=UPI00370997A0
MCLGLALWVQALGLLCAHPALAQPGDPEAHLNMHYFDDNVIDLLEALNVTRSVKGVSKVEGPEPGVPAWKFRQRVPHLTLPWDYSVYLLSAMQGALGFHFVAKQARGTESALISFLSPAALQRDGHPLIQLFSSTRTNQLRLEYRSAPGMQPASMLFPGGSPFTEMQWTRVALNLEAHKVTLFVDCEESIVMKKDGEEEILSLILPLDLEITFASAPGNKSSKFVGYWQTAEISPSGFLHRPWHCENRADSLPLPYTMPEERYMDHLDHTPSKQEAPQPLEPLVLADIRNYQQQQSEPAASPGTRRVLPRGTSQEERLRSLEEALEGMSAMLDMVKGQNADLMARVTYLETCECRRPKCSWEGREHEEGDTWDKDGCHLCTCIKGEVKCSLRRDQFHCQDPCTSSPCLNGGQCQPVRPDTRQHPTGFMCQCPLRFTGLLCEKPRLQTCSMPQDDGQCTDGPSRQPKQHWFYSAKHRRCIEFLYTGCGGNANNFPSQEECQSRCEVGACCYRTPTVSRVLIGYDHEGYDRYGYNSSGVDRNQRNRVVFNPVRSGPALFGPNGQIFSGLNDGREFDKYGFDQQGYDRDGFHKETGFNFTGYNRKGEHDGRMEFSSEGYDRNGYNRAGFNCGGLGADGFSYLEFCAGFTYQCESLSLSQCQAMDGRVSGREVVSFSPGKKCEETACREQCGCSYVGRTYRFGESFEYGCEVCLCSYTGAVECNCRQVSQRKEIRDMTAEERNIYQKAIRDLYAKEDMWEEFARLKAEYCPQANGRLTFLPWHRYFLRLMERELQKVSSCDIAIPYFEWTVDSGSLETSVVWQANFFGGDGDSRSSCVLHHPFLLEKNWEPCLRRRFNTSIVLPDVINIQLILAEESFQEFSFHVEMLSGLFHLWVGGHMASLFSAYDPIFLSHYAFIDKLWTLWQEKSSDGLPRYPSDARYIKMKPFDVAPDDILLAQQQLCIRYISITLGAPCNYTVIPKHHELEGQVFESDYGPFDLHGYNMMGYDRRGFDQQGWNQYGYGRNGFDRDGFDVDGFDISGYNRYGFNRSQVTPFGMRKDGTLLPEVRAEVIDPLFKKGYNTYGYDRSGMDRNGFDVFGFNLEGYDRDQCNYFFHGPHYLRFYFFIQQQVYVLGKDVLTNIKRICPPISPLPSWWLQHSWVTQEVLVTLQVVRQLEERWTSQHMFDSHYIPNISSVRENNLWLPVTPDLRLCFEAHFFSGCPLGTTPVSCPDLCQDEQCVGHPSAECRVQMCGSCFAEWYDQVTGNSVLCHGCIYEGQTYQNGDSFSTNTCTTCVCLNGVISCKQKECPPVMCESPVESTTDKCCPRCVEGCADGHQEGETWKPEPCNTCTCLSGQVQCVTKTCAPSSCEHPIIPRGKCCPECAGCVYNGHRLRNGQSYQEDRCTKCTCRSGTVLCERAGCPELSCLDQYTPPGECCPICRPGCEYEGEHYQDGDYFLARTNPCTNCSCLNNLVRCTPVHCQPSRCANPIQRPGHCCFMCPACELDGHHLEHGHTAITIDGCRRCICQGGALECTDIQQCSQQCTHGVKPRPGSCCPDCSLCDYHGQIVPNGMFRSTVNVCEENCRCQDGNVVCQKTSCKELNCSLVENVPGECCPRCHGCLDGTSLHQFGEEWTHAEDPCTICTCWEGSAFCRKKDCAEQCSFPERPKASTCCPVCDGCFYHGREYQNKQTFTDSKDPCSLCTCDRGSVFCNLVTCPQVYCRNPTRRTGECCPRCEECEYESQVYADGAVFISPRDPCLNCRCLAGEVSCDRMDHSCSPPQCSHPGKINGQCCSSCEYCDYKGTLYVNGQTFSPPGSGPCLQCTCLGGNVRCQEESCPPPACARPVRDPQHCCPICKVCVLDGTEFDEGVAWEPDGEPCSTCTCVNGDTVCGATQCPPIACLHPSQTNGDCCPTCNKCTYNQRIYSDGQEFIDPDEPCQNCKCQDGTVQCSHTVCPPVTCSRPERRAGQCCPKCPDCTFELRVFLDGEQFANPLNTCQECRCSNGRVTCEDRKCLGALCSYPLPGTCCQNNCNGCSFAGKEYPNGADFPHPTDKCKQCHCINGNVQCLYRRCPPMPCAEPFKVPGECCPQCPVPPAECHYVGLSYKHMQRFYDPSDKCRDCICNNGTITCQRKPCASIQCTHPLQQDCCRSCEGCLLHGRELANGEQFSDPSDPCSKCVCWEGSVSCEPRTCPILECPFPVKGHCCKACEGCEYLGEEYLNGQEFTNPQDQCSRCACLNGFVHCNKKPCYKPGCTHPITLPNKCCPVCEGCFYNDVAISNGQSFPDPAEKLCSQCTCRAGSVQCVRKLCSPAPCQHPVMGPCDCPLCQGCYFEGTDYVDGDIFPSPKGGCEQCRCQRGEVACGPKTCSKAPCLHPTLDPCRCPVCSDCSFHGRDCRNGERFPDPDDRCRYCTCLNGDVTCTPLTCPPVSCRHPTTPPGECCPVCTGRCDYNGQLYENGEVFLSPVDKCAKCTCLSEVVTCLRNPCAQQCTHAVPSSFCCPTCDSCFFQGQEYANRQTFTSPSDACQRCSCLSGNVLCTTLVCPQTTCASPITKPGQCCPECQVCLFQGKEYAEGSHVYLAPDACEKCSCLQGKIVCNPVLCDVPCTHPSRVPGKCCPICVDCLFEGLLYNSGSAFDPDPCRQCSCQAGNVYCEHTPCPPLACMHQVTDPGICCPRCRGCVYNGREYRDGTSWLSPTTPCMSCMCVDGVTTCSETRCIGSCANPIQVPGECCPLCADCVYNNHVYSPGESFQLSDDPCEICTCELMPDGQQYRHCNRKQCPSLVDCPKSHIQPPGPGHCCPTCAQALSNCTATMVGNEVHATDDPCYMCQCKDLTWVCIHQGCPLLSCPRVEQFMPRGSCCPVCNECVVEAENRRVSDGESWTDSVDDCITCTCQLGHIECHIQECLPTVCKDGLVKVRGPGRCCYECQDPKISCSYRGQMYQSNEHWEVDECTTCTCVSGEVHCQSERCPQVSCASDETPALIPGMCCPHCIPRPATCIAFGDPHYRTFDGKMFHFQGSCTYVLAEDCEGGDFSIHVTNDDRGRKGVSWTKEVTVLIGDVVVQLLQDWIVVVDYQTVDLPFLKEPYIYIERKTNTILLNTNIGLKVLWNGKSHLEVSVPGTYKAHMCGLCGNFNNYPQDDMRIRSGQIVLSEASFGNSWKVQSDNYTTSQCSDGHDVEPCKEAGYRARKEANAKCKVLKSKVFERCHAVVPPEMFFASCVYDLCACGSNADECLCDALEAYASECRESGVILQWRSPSLCAVGCPHDRGFVFDECGPPCPKTCFNKDVPLGTIESHCFKPCVPGCQCPAGLVEHDSHCIFPEACPKIIYGSL